MNNYEAVIGLEIHAELKTKSKMFCSCKNLASSLTNRDDKLESVKQNENICPVCLGMPGTLPVLNKQAIDWTIMTGLATNCQIAEFTKWDRKNYFYPDLPKGYQISQYDLPICKDGYLEIENSESQTSKIRITRIHLEEDTGTSKHPEGKANIDYSLLDYNRAGVPLMELVTEPDIKSAEIAKEFCKKYQVILRNLGVSDANMEKGQMRCEANISIMPIGSKKFGTKVEVKNLNSFKAVERAIKYEIERQKEALEFGEKIVQETRGWDDVKARTYTMRVKETSADYRYFPEPDLPPVLLSKFEIDKLKKQMPESFLQKEARYIQKYKLSKNNARQISSIPEIAFYFEKTIKETKYPNDLANLIVNSPQVIDMSSKDLAKLTNLVGDGTITKANAKEIIPEVIQGKKIDEIIKNKGFKQISDISTLEKIIEKIIKDNPKVVEKIKNGQMNVMGFIVGQVMKETKGQANPKLVNEIIRKKI